MDTAPSISQENEAILKDLDPEVVVAEPGPLAREGAVRTILLLQGLRGKLLGIVGNRALAPDIRSAPKQLEVLEE